MSERRRGKHQVQAAGNARPEPAKCHQPNGASRQERDLGSAILDVVGALVVVLDRQGRIVRFNPACERTTGYAQEEVTGVSFWDLFLIPEEVEPVKAVFAELRAGAYPNEHENYWLTKDGERRLIRWSNTALLDDGGQVAYVIGTGIDITERGQAQEMLQKLSYDLSVRVKELNCLLAISKLVEEPDATLGEIARRTVELLPSAWQYPEIACARVSLDGQEFSTENYRHTDWRQSHELWVRGRRAGELEVCYLEERLDGDSGPFLDEEEGLIGAVAERLSSIAERMEGQEALKRSEERYALAQRAAAIGSWDWDVLTGDLRWSEQIEPIFGFGRGEFGATYEAFLDCVHPEDRSYVRWAVDACLEQDADYAIEHRIVWSDGTVRWVSENGDVVRDEDGTAVRMLGVVQDITERKQAEEQMRQHEAFLTSVLESLTHPFYVVRVADHTVEMANTATYRNYLSQHAKCYVLSHHRDTPCTDAGYACPIEELVVTKKPVVVEHVHYDADGKARHVEVRCYPLLDDQGNVVRAIEYCLDITQRKQAEEALRDSEARWRSVTENSPDHVIVLDKDLNIQFVNYASPGLTVEELIGTPLWSYVEPKRQPELKEILESVLRTRQPRTYETEYHALDGSTIYYESRAVARVVDGQVVGLAVNARDITEHKRTERALREAKEAAERARRQEQERWREADRRRRIAESLAGVLVALNSDQPLEQVLDYIAAQATQLLNSHAVAICRLADEDGALSVQVARCLPAGRVEGVEELAGMEAVRQAVALRQAVAIPDLGAATARSPAGAGCGLAPFGAALAAPIVVQEGVYGGMLLYYACPRSFSRDEMELAGVFCNQIALAVGNARLREQAQHAAVAAERSRLARDLHDSVTQALFSASLVAEVLPQVWRRNPEEVWQGIEELRQLTRGALAEMRTLLLELRPTALLETKLHDLLMQLTEGVTGRSQLSVALNVDPSPPLPAEVHVTFYRVAQEALNNVVKHAGANHLSLSLQVTPPLGAQRVGDWRGTVSLRVSDDGQGFEVGQKGADQLGLAIMRERAVAAGARLSIESQPGQGTRVVLVWEGAPR